MPVTAPERPAVPASTYRLQISAAFTLDDACAVVPYLHDLGVSHLYLSPLLQASAGSTHGYDVVDHDRIDASRGGLEGLRRLAAAAHARGMGLVLDIVPNHMSIAVPRENAAWWDVLKLGRDSTFARWFDIDWEAGPLLVPVLGADEDVRDLKVEGDALAYYEHRFPIAPRTGDGSPQQIHARQAYRLVGWRHEAADLTYRRFFDVTTLAGVRVEADDVYAATHRLVRQLSGEGTVDGLRVDHPDGLADPAGYFAHLAADTGDAWVVAEKILQPGEVLPPEWKVAGTTGYDAARLVSGLFVDPAGEVPLTALWQRITGDTTSMKDKELAAQHAAIAGPLRSELNRLGRLAPDISLKAIAEVLVQLAVYRSYLPASGIGWVRDAFARAEAARRDLEPDLRALQARFEDGTDPLAVRFQQTSGMVMAKGVEDTAYYRHHVLSSLCEVGGDPSRFGVSIDEWHRWCTALQATTPHSMTLLTSHDTKRSEDVRARIGLLSELPEEWASVSAELFAAAAPYRGAVAGEDEYLLQQTLVGVGLVDADRITEYMGKAVREAKRHTAWVDGNAGYDRDVEHLVRAALADERYTAALRTFLARLEPHWQRTVLAQKLLQLTMPGIPDVYQGTEHPCLALVDPDNRRAVDWSTGPDTKTALVAAVLRLRRDQPQLFVDYRPVETHSSFAVAFARSEDLMVLVSRLSAGIERHGWGDAELELPPGSWVDVLTDRPVTSRRLAELLGDRPGAVLRRVSSA